MSSSSNISSRPRFVPVTRASDGATAYVNIDLVQSVLVQNTGRVSLLFTNSDAMEIKENALQMRTIFEP